MYPIIFCIVGMVLAVRLKIVPTVDCYTRLCTKNAGLVISRFRILLTRRVFRKLNTKKFVTNL